ncbi:unnamed protein product, partial [Enterobius vermicularis]|uniref:Neur_chan_memb domain-containing protein n=1 Tax=Enterobius vermicularis TaxID=51028 RepID=A0A0N4VRE3_ENTVE
TNTRSYGFSAVSGFVYLVNYFGNAYDVEQLKVEWNEPNSIGINEDIMMPDMRLKEIKPTLKNTTYVTGIWSCAIAQFVVDREIMHHLLQSYLPTALIVVISWFGFWLDVESVPGRVSLSITTLLTLATQSSAARMALPQASYVKAIDVWIGTCMAFAFAAMIEFTVVSYCLRVKWKQKDKGFVALFQQMFLSPSPQVWSAYQNNASKN